MPTKEELIANIIDLCPHQDKQGLKSHNKDVLNIILRVITDKQNSNSTIPNNDRWVQQERIIAGKKRQIQNLVKQLNHRADIVYNIRKINNETKTHLHGLLATIEDFASKDQLSEGANLKLANELLKIHNNLNKVNTTSYESFYDGSINWEDG